MMDKKHKEAFTLIEMLLSLFVFSLIISGLMACFNHYNQINEYIRFDQSTEWQLFTITLEKELEQFKFEKVQNNIIYLRDPTNNQAYQIIYQNNKIYKTPGHHPYLYQVKNWTLNLNDNIIDIRLQFQNLQVFESRLLIRQN